MSTRPEEKEAEAFDSANAHATKNENACCNNWQNYYQGYLAGATAEAKKAVELIERLKAAENLLRSAYGFVKYGDNVGITEAEIRSYLARYPQKGGSDAK